MINFDDINEVKKAIKIEQNKMLRIKLKIERLKKIVEAHNQGIYKPDLYDELMKRSTEV